MTDNHLLADLCSSIDALAPELLDLQHDLHAHPELSRGETRTTATVAARLAAAGIAHRTLPVSADWSPTWGPSNRHTASHCAPTSTPCRWVSGPSCPGPPRPRASATPAATTSTSPPCSAQAWRSRRTRKPCASAASACACCSSRPRRSSPEGRVDLLAEGALDDVDAIFAVHCDPSLDVGSVGLRPGAITAAADRVTVHLSGRGGHTSRPHLTEDLTFALAKVVTELPAVLSRRLDPRTAFALVWGEVHAGQAANVIPSSGTAAGTLRMLDVTAWTTIGPLLAEAVEHVVAPYAVTAVLEHVQGVPPVVNDPEAIEVLRAAAEGAGLTAVGTPQSLGGEDFAWYLRRVPGAMARLGTRTPGGPTFDLHQGDLVVDEDSVVQGARLLAGVVVSGVVKSRIGAPAPA